jgi:RNA polymerase sigma-70 factor (ECF subfamily)
VLVRRARDPKTSPGAQSEAFAALVERFQAMALAAALNACGDVDEARDACQNAFIVAWRSLPRLREPAAFGSWLKRLVRTQCARARRRELGRSWDNDEVADDACDPAETLDRRASAAMVRLAVQHLPQNERQAVSLFYFAGESLQGVARTLGITVASAGKRIYSARLRLRQELPRSVARVFLGMGPSWSFARDVQAGVFDEFVGEYRFPKRPKRPVIVRREGGLLVSYASGQRCVLASRRPDRFNPAEFDGEARFRRDREGRVTQFVYYEFGRRLGVARKVT